jgi:hypothetical protein
MKNSCFKYKFFCFFNLFFNHHQLYFGLGWLLGIMLSWDRAIYKVSYPRQAYFKNTWRLVVPKGLIQYLILYVYLKI